MPPPADVTGTIVPLYTSPSHPSWTAVIAAKKAHPTVPVIAVVNPANGPGSAINAGYVAGIGRLVDAGIKVIGYVATGYTGVPEATVRADIDRWKNLWERQPKGVDQAHYRPWSPRGPESPSFPLPPHAMGAGPPPGAPATGPFPPQPRGPGRPPQLPRRGPGPPPPHPPPGPPPPPPPRPPPSAAAPRVAYVHPTKAPLPSPTPAAHPPPPPPTRSPSSSRGPALPPAAPSCCPWALRRR